MYVRRRVSIIIGVVAALIVLVIGSLYGSIAGFAGGKVDFIMMRIVDVIYSVPDVLIVLLLQVVLKDPLQAWFDGSSNPVVEAMSSLGVGIVSIFITFALLYWVGMSRIIRGQVLSLKQQEYVTAATVLGASPGQDYPQTPAPQLCGPADYFHLSADTVGHLPGVLPLLPGTGCVGSHGFSGLSVLRCQGNLPAVSLPAVVPRHSAQPDRADSEPGGRWPCGMRWIPV